MIDQDTRKDWVPVPKKPTPEMSQAVLEETRFCNPVGIYQKMLAAAPQVKAHPAITHCDNCGCDWLDSGLNPIGCPYCKQAALQKDEAVEWLRGHVSDLRSAARVLRESPWGAKLAATATEVDKAADEATLAIAALEAARVERDALLDALRQITEWPDGGNTYGQEKIKRFAQQAIDAAMRKEGK